MTTKPILQTGCAEIVSPGTIVSNHAVAYRLARRKGELILQGAYRWQQGSMSGFEWRDIPIVDLDEPKPKPTPEEPPASPTKRELFELLLQSGGATRCVSIEWIESFANAVLERWGQ